jgi:hypothetical protein
MKVNKIVVLGWMMMFVGFLVDPFAQVCGEPTAKGQQKKGVTVTDSLTLSSERSNDVKTLATFDSLIIIHFHPTVQCSCCINVGNFAKKGLEKYYAKPYKEGRIIFKECNSEEDSLTAKKYKIFQSALGFRKIFKGKEEFKEIESVWEFCEDEAKFLPNFKKELDDFIGALKKEKRQPKTQNEKTSR